MNAIEVRDVTKQLSHFTIQGLNFSIPKGYVTGFIGQNGSGKTTTIQLIMDVLRPNKGEIKLFDAPNRDVETKQRIGFVYDELYMYQHVTINQMRSFIKPLYDTWDDNLFNYYRREFNLPTRQKIKGFSKGMKMKTSLLFALAHDPELLIMDEPTAGLDPVFRRELIDLFHELMEDEKRTIFFSTHITSDLDRLADYIVLIDYGKIQLQQSMTDLEENYHLVKGTKEQLSAIGKEAFLGVRVTNQGFSGLYQGDTQSLLLLQTDQPMVIEKPSLEDMMYLMKGKKR